MKQYSVEIIDQYKQSRDQVISACLSTKFREKLLRKTALTLTKVTQINKTMENAECYAKNIEHVYAENPPTHHQDRYFVSSRQNLIITHSNKSNQTFSPNRVPKPNTMSSTSISYQQNHQPNNQPGRRCLATGSRTHECRRSRGITCTKFKKTGHFHWACHTQKNPIQASLHQSNRQSKQ